MKVETANLWNKIPGECTEVPTITAYIPENKTSDAAVVVFAGGGYSMRASYEGKDYAEFLAENGICAFDVAYRVAPAEFPLPLLDARRGVKYARYFAEKYGINKNKIAVMGSSAGGHLSALCSTYKEEIDFEVEQDEIEKEAYLPNAQILCYPVIKLTAPIGHEGSGKNLLGGQHSEKMVDELCPELIADESVPPAFIWHTFDDQVVNVINSLDYAKRIRELGGEAEVHIFPNGHHGMGLSLRTDDEAELLRGHVRQWSELLINWLRYIGF